MPKFSRMEIPLDQNRFRRLIPWIIALMVYLGTMALTGAVLLHHTVESWQKDFKNGFIAELQVTEAPFGQSSSQALEEQTKLLNALRSLPGVIQAEPLVADSPLSALDSQTPLWKHGARFHRILIDVTLAREVKIDVSALELELRALFPGVSIRDYQAWRDLIVRIGHSLLGISLVIAGSIGFVCVITIAFITHSGLVIHEKVIEILRLVGAENRYIAKQFQAYSLKMALQGGIIGALLSIATYFVMKDRLETVILDFFPAHEYEPELWFIIFFTPLFMMIIVMLSARMTVLFSMREE